MDQTYEWDDRGTNWTGLPLRRFVCPGEEPKDARWGGSTQIHVDGDDATVIEDSYSWTIDTKGDAAAGSCLHVRKSKTHRTRILKNGTLSDVTESTERPTRRTEKAYPPPRKIAVGGMTTLPGADDRFVDRFGDSTIAGHPCQRIAPKANLGGVRMALCIFAMPRSCQLSAYVQPLELTIMQSDGQVTAHGITTSLRFAGRSPPAPKAIQ